MLGQANLSEWHQWVNDGALAAFAVFVCVLVYRIVVHGGNKLLQIGERYVSSTEQLHDTLKDSEDNRSKLCDRHATGLEAMAGAMQVSNRHLDRLVHLHEDPGGNVHDAIGTIHDNNKSMQQVKRALQEACELWRYICKQEFPNCAERVGQHCDAIKQIIDEA